MIPTLDTIPVFTDNNTQSRLTATSHNLKDGFLLLRRNAQQKARLFSSYPHAKVKEKPIFQFRPQIDNYFLATPKGKVLRLAIQHLVKNNGLIETSEQEVFHRLNRLLTKGTCRGEALAYLLASHEKQEEKRERADTYIEKRITALFLQIFLHVEVDLQKYIEKTQDQFAFCCNTMMKMVEMQKWMEAGLTTISHELVETKDALKKKFNLLFQERNQDDFLVSFSFEHPEDENHVLLLQPSKKAIYDSQYGLLSFETLEDMLGDIELYMHREAVTRGSIQTVSSTITVGK
ncbi:MAG: hypothetical protein JWO53_948 [Chlamydiia bacterium]|nr:hypothetical protein [Chlamydiia bacterium]